MTEVSFARSFLSALDTKPQRLTPDHVEDPRSYPARAPFTLPRNPKPMSRPAARGRPAPGAERRIAVAVRPLRGGGQQLGPVPAQPPTASALDVRAAVARGAGIAPERVRLLLRKKPVPDSRALGDLLAAGEDALEFQVMIMGGAADTPAAAPAPAPAPASVAAAGTATGAAVLETEAFWADLKGFLMQRLRDEGTALEALGRFREAWQARS